MIALSSKVLKEKYFRWISHVQWIRSVIKLQKGTSNIWNRLLDAFDICGSWLAWVTGNGRSIQMGDEPIIVGPVPYKVFDNLKFIL